MKIPRLAFRHSDLENLSKDEQMLFIRLANILNDVRLLWYWCSRSAARLRRSSEDERPAYVHNLLFTLRMLYGVIFEGWEAYQKLRSNCGPSFKPNIKSHLQQESEEAISSLNRFFNKRNPIGAIRHAHAFHYDTKESVPENHTFEHSDTHEVFVGSSDANVFYAFAEDYRMREITNILCDDGSNDRDAVYRFSSLILVEICPKFMTAINDVLSILLRRVGAKKDGSFEVEATTTEEEVAPLFLRDVE